MMFLISSSRRMLPMMLLLVFLLCGSLASARKKKANDDNDTDRFNYRQTIGTDYGPADWNQVNCKTVGNCLGWPDGWELGVGWELGPYNQCQWCPADNDNDNDNNIDCGLHRQSPIDLLRTTAQTGHDTECYDYHWMAYQDGSCQWHNMVRNGYTTPETSFRIRRHALQILTPVDDDTGRLQCGRDDQFPRLDYSKGFPDWWFLSHTEITTPSEHFQNGKRYDAEVHLSHFYSVQHERKIGIVAIFLQVDNDDTRRKRWNFLDKLICQWREVEEQQRQECGLESVPISYPGCRNPKRQRNEVIEQQKPKDPYPFIDCDTVENHFRICKETSCCEMERSTTDYCVNDVYERFGEEMTGSICWWCCPGKLLDRKDGESPPFPTESPTTTNPTSVAIPLPTPSNASPPPPAPSSMVVLLCDDFDGQPGIDLNRICKDDACCDPERSSTDHCHYVYKFFGNAMEQVCLQCCDPPKNDIGSPPPTHPIYPPIDCTMVSNPHRMCKSTSCCNDEKSNSDYCLETYEQYGNAMGSICWYCCSEPKEVDPSLITILDSTIPSLLPTRSPSERPSNTDQPTSKPTDTPTFTPSLSSRPTSTPTKKPSMTPSFHPTSLPTTFPSKNNPTVPPTVTFVPTSRTTTIEPFQCDKYDGMDGIEIHRICKTDGCCDPIRSSTNQCHYVYKFFGEDEMARLCSDCCNNKELAAPPSPHPTYPPIDCTLVSNPFRICKPTSCCNEERSDTWYCKDIYETYGDAMGSICWYCCSQPKEVDPTVLNRRRRLVSTATTTTTSSSSSSPQQDDIMELSVADVSDKGGGGGVVLPQGLRANEIRLDPVSFEAIADEKQQQQQHITEEMKDYYSTSSRKPHNHHQQESNSTLRNLQNDVPSGNNYVNVRYSPYEWLREVKTEYYFRYEGGQMVPPCYETVHYRVMKDPIRIHSIQLEEIERLLAWRIAPKGSGENECQRDTAGRERPGSKNGNAVDLNRPLQAYSNIHRKVFCECNDWDSKWKEDQEWCKLDKKTRFFDRPYNFL